MTAKALAGIDSDEVSVPIRAAAVILICSKSSFPVLFIITGESAAWLLAPRFIFEKFINETTNDIAESSLYWKVSESFLDEAAVPSNAVKLITQFALAFNKIMLVFVNEYPANQVTHIVQSVVLE